MVLISGKPEISGLLVLLRLILVPARSSATGAGADYIALSLSGEGSDVIATNFGG